MREGLGNIRCLIIVVAFPVGPIKPRMRNFLVDWLIEVHQQFSLIQETLYLTVAILDRFLQEEGASISTKQLQLVGVTAMLVAAKYEEMYPPEVDDFVYITDKAYKQSEILQMEIRILKTLFIQEAKIN